VSSKSPFIVPCTPVQRGRPPVGDDWLHEVKFDGWRVQLHKSKRRAIIYSRTGRDFTARFPTIAAAVASLPLPSVVLDGELTACDPSGLPDFRALHFREVEDHDLCVWVFDILQLDNIDLREVPLIKRRKALEKILYKANDNALRLSETFDDGEKLLASCEEMRLEGIVSKRRDFSYRSGKSDVPVWVNGSK
jgi:bifunctional non-homologous end joining protein LigD